MLFMTGLTLLALGIAVWLFGNRMWLLGAGAGALLGFALLRLFPGMADGWLGLVIVGGLAILLGVLAFFGKAFAGIIAMVIGFIAGDAIVLSILDSLTLDLGLVGWILGLIGGVVGAILFRRFLNWGLIIFASLLGSLLIVRPLVDVVSVAGRNARHAVDCRADGRWASSITTASPRNRAAKWSHRGYRWPDAAAIRLREGNGYCEPSREGWSWALVASDLA